MDIPPSPNDQYQLVGVFEDKSLNDTVRGTVPEVGVPVNAAIGSSPAARRVRFHFIDDSDDSDDNNA